MLALADFNHFYTHVLEHDLREVLLFRVDLVQPRLQSIFAVSCVDNCLVQSFAEAFLVHPIVADSSFDFFQVNILAELFELLKLYFAENSEKSRRCHIKQLAV